MGSFVVTSGGDMQFAKHVIHLSTPHEGKVANSKESIKQIMMGILNFMDSKKLKRLALPPIGTGIAGVSVNNFVTGFYEGVSSYIRLNQETNV